GSISDGTFPVEFWYLLGQSNYLLGRKQQARDPLLRVIAGNSFYPFARYTLAQVEFALGRADTALGALAEVTSGANTPQLLKDRAIRAAGMILYQQKRYTDSVRTYKSIAQTSSLYGSTRIDLALAADAAGDEQTAEQAFADAMEHGNDDLIRTEARVAVGRFLNKRQKAAAARTLFEQALGDLRTREARLREAVEVEGQFRDTFGELVAFARQSGGNPRRERLAEDLALLRSTLASTMGVTYERATIPGFEKLSPRTYLFPLLQQHFHNPAIVETFVELEVELEDMRKQIDRLANEVRAQAEVWTGNPPIKAGAVPEDIKNSISEMHWLVFGVYDLQTRFFDAMAVNEKIDQATVVREKRRALGQTLDALRLLLFGGRRVPSPESMLGLLEQARVKIESGKLPGMMATKVREGFLQEWKADRDSLTYVVENLNLKERQMNNALTGVPLRSRNVNLPVLSTMSDWLTALQQLVYKYQFIETPRDQRPWHLAGLNADVSMVLAESTRDLQGLQQRSVAVVRDVARDLVSKQQFRHALIAAQADEGIADALFQERAGR
ncbi:MAG: tetratricopeptide repeat protein, partial [Candidatus Binatia bacterium]